MTPRPRAVAYIRVSSQQQLENESMATQESKIVAYAESLGVDIVRTFREEGVSAKTAMRPQLQELIAFAIRNKVDYVLVYKMNRLSRNMDSYSQIRVLLTSKGIQVRSATETIEDNPVGKFLENVFIANAQLDNDIKSQMTRDNMQSLAKQGYWQHHPWLGYRPVKMPNDSGKPRPTMKPDTKAPLVKQLLERFTEGDISKAGLTEYAKDIGLRSRNGKVLSKDSINRMLETPIYAGKVVDRLTDGEVVEGKHPALISEATYETNQFLLHGKDSRKGQNHRKISPIYPLKGFVTCSSCDGLLYASAPTSGSGKGSPRYHCSRKGCSAGVKSIRASVVNGGFEALLKELEPTPKLLKLYRQVLKSEYVKHLGSLNTKIRHARDELSQIDRTRMNVLKKFADEELSLDEKTQMIDELDIEKSKLMSELKELDQQQFITEADIDSGLNFMQHADKQWQRLDVEGKQAFQKMVFPGGMVYDMEQQRFGTKGMSPLYRGLETEKGSEEPSKSDLVAGAGLEPATLWL